MKQHQYHITVQHVADAKGQPSTYQEDLSFDAANHDDIFAIVEKLKKLNLFEDPQTVTSFAVGLKLFSEVMLENKNHPLFKDFSPHFGQFMKKLKQSNAEASFKELHK
ncbi:DUF3861 domain-containing protein [Acinetobacter puyangensis]|uniref:DUF3861 domain-containing protein n=1 Tax=Acinetobacter puyangensis TaxID=1096779 RepID=A0A240EBZ1_9GAMM|nr:DUF3861 domain-containing protein [Acinetobacter puyangensis]SNX46056.1 protein of unknown function [Acinetobacter puyangensis]